MCHYFPGKCLKFSFLKNMFSTGENGIEKKKGNINENVKERDFFFFPTLNMRKYTSWSILHRFFHKNILVPQLFSQILSLPPVLNMTCDLQQVTVSMGLGSTSYKPAITEGFNGLHSLNLQSFFQSSRWGWHEEHAKSGEKLSLLFTLMRLFS